MGVLSSPSLSRYLLLTSLCLSLLFILLTIALTRDGRVLSFTHFYTDAPGGSLSYSLGYTTITECWASTINPALDQCNPQSLQSYDAALGGVCHRGGVGLIALYALTLVLLLTTATLTALTPHLSSLCTPTTPHHPLLSLTNLTSLLCLISSAFSIAPLAVWYSSCQATLSNAFVTYADDPSHTHWPILGLRIGGGMALATLAIALTACSLALAVYCSVTEYRARRDGSAVAFVRDEELLSTGKWGRLKEEQHATIAVSTSSHGMQL